MAESNCHLRFPVSGGLLNGLSRKFVQEVFSGNLTFHDQDRQGRRVWVASSSQAASAVG